MPSRTATKAPVANSGGSGTKRGRVSSGAPFYNGRHVTPRGCCCSVKQGRQFLNKISTCYAVLFIWPLSRAAPIGRKFASRLRAPKVDPPRLASSIQLSNFLSILHKPLRASGAWHHSHPVTPFRHLGLLWHLWVARPPRVSVTTYIKVCT